MDLVVLSNVTAGRVRGGKGGCSGYSALPVNNLLEMRERDLARFGLSRYFLSPAQWNIIWVDKAGITHNFLVFSPEQHLLYKIDRIF